MYVKYEKRNWSFIINLELIYSDVETETETEIPFLSIVLPLRYGCTEYISL